ncbi:lysozyme inhibitor LprI family protein [Maricaulis sp. CAU 1757]
MYQTLIAAFGAVSLLGSAASAQTPPPYVYPVGMPALSPAEMIDNCLQREQARGQQANCIGEYSSLCMDQPENQTTAGMIECTVAEFEVWDAKLNTAYTELHASLPPSRANSLRDAQRAWIRLRDADCDYVTSVYQGGSLQPWVRSSCWLDYAAARTLTLTRWIEEPY